jgi:hypothetical protein
MLSCSLKGIYTSNLNLVVPEVKVFSVSVLGSESFAVLAVDWGPLQTISGLQQVYYKASQK